MSNTIALKPISDLLGENFYIPSYQRGYRWTRKQVLDLLDDVHSFAIRKNKSEKEFYCLQPVIVKKRSWEREGCQVNGYELIDGQQRMTTIRILLKYFVNEFISGNSFEKMYSKELFNMDYQTRNESTNFLDNIDKKSNENIDFYHIGQCYLSIEYWISEQKKKGHMFSDLCDSIIKTLVHNIDNQKSEGIAQVIWYELTDENANPIDTFIRINLGKINLTSAELIKALFLQENNFGKDDLANLKQLEIAQEWDLIENSLQDNNFWWFLNNGINNIPSRIAFIFELMFKLALNEGEKKDELLKITGTDKDATFRYFNHLRSQKPDYVGLKELWESVKKKFEMLQEWYNHPTWYHYIGFLIYNNASNIESIFKLTELEDVKTKEDFTEKLIHEIQFVFRSIKWSIDKNINENDYSIILKYDNSLTRKFLLMFNLEYIVKKSGMKTLMYKFPFEAFKKQTNENSEKISWDVEHIDSSTENDLTKRQDQVIWLNNAVRDLHILESREDLLEIINNFMNNTNPHFEPIKQEIIELSGENKIKLQLKDDIGNLALLDSKTNRGYGNALFVTKRRIIIDNDNQGRFIPLCTKNVFLKYFDTQMGFGSKWTNEDILSYRNIMQNTLMKFLPSKPTKNIDENV